MSDKNTDEKTFHLQMCDKCQKCDKVWLSDWNVIQLVLNDTYEGLRWKNSISKSI